jgi:hypothetical protein
VGRFGFNDWTEPLVNNPLSFIETAGCFSTSKEFWTKVIANFKGCGFFEAFG